MLKETTLSGESHRYEYAQYPGFEVKIRSHFHYRQRRKCDCNDSTVSRHGLRVMVDGVILNAQMASFSTKPTIENDKPTQNAIKKQANVSLSA
ncbi:hypothetical protein O9992_27685 [Vibrio lentus]|nr:hypothetical protein [Vibrio lentus]